MPTYLTGLRVRSLSPFLEETKRCPTLGDAARSKIPKGTALRPSSHRGT
ncbi:hypothetical protein [Nostoc sp.]